MRGTLEFFNTGFMCIVLAIVFFSVTLKIVEAAKVKVKVKVKTKAQLSEGDSSEDRSI